MSLETARSVADTSAPDESGRRHGIRGVAREVFSYHESGVFIALVLLLVSLSLVSPTFRQTYNLTIILDQMSVVAIMALGQTLVIISGAFDISQGPVAGLAAMLSALAWLNLGVPPAAALALGVAVGLGCGITNGVLATHFKLHPIVMTLATSTIFTGINYFVTRGSPVIDLPPAMTALGDSDVGGVPTPAIVMIVVAILMHVLLTRTLFGLRVRQIGGNLTAARLSGVNVSRTWVAVFAISGLLAGLGGIILLGRVGNAIPSIGQTLLFPIISSTIIGGTLLSGGVGSMIGTVMGAAILSIINNALVVLEVNIYAQDIVQGGLVVAALLVDQFRRGTLTWGDVFKPRL